MQQALASKNKTTNDVVADQKRRLFLKSLGTLGLGVFGASLFPKKTSALVMGGTPATSVVGVKDASDVRISPATETSLASSKTNTDTLVTNSNKFIFSGNNLLVASASGSDAAGLKDADNIRIDPTSEDSVVMLRRVVKLLESRATVDVANRKRITVDAWGENLSGPVEMGTATGTQNTMQLVDNTKFNTWLINKWSYFALKITGGTGIGQIRMIDTNTSTALTLQYPWSTIPDETSTYCICEADSAVSVVGQAVGTQGLYTLADTTKAWTTNAWANNYAVRIVSDLGDVQIRLILSNTATVLTLATPWTARIGETPDQDSGTATDTQSVTTLTDTTKVWADNNWANYIVTITSGTGVEQTLRIASNTSDTLSLVGSWSTIPDATSTYAIRSLPSDASVTGTATWVSDSSFLLIDTSKAWTTNMWANYLVKITSGTGAGQVRHIASNTATVLTVSAIWQSLPDSTSTYAIYPVPARSYDIRILPTANLDVGRIAGMPRLALGTNSTVGTMVSVANIASIGSYASQQRFGDISHRVYNNAIRSKLTFS
ncbi:hypothetical protein KBC40_02690 [Patescibacteria group bacterium]|nr:hypothetical protein [Patescibacteria group bacterium]